MKEVVYNTAVVFSKKDLILNGLGGFIHACLGSLLQESRDKFADLILQDLKDESNKYQMVLSIKKLED